jgi:hypothetical protein
MIKLTEVKAVSNVEDITRASNLSSNKTYEARWTSFNKKVSPLMYQDASSAFDAVKIIELL